ncbi:MAG: hypothetical protein ACI93H_001163 [Psychromonas sp.]|jgi:hypothetical protein
MLLLKVNILPFISRYYLANINAHTDTFIRLAIPDFNLLFVDTLLLMLGPFSGLLNIISTAIGSFF